MNAPFTQPNLGPPFGNREFSADASGNRLIITPEFSGNVQANYKVAVGAGELDLSGSYSYNGGYYWAADNRVRQKAYGLVAAQAMWTAPGGHSSIRIWGRNLTNQHYLAGLNENNTGDILSPAAGRLYGASVGFKF